MSFLAGYIVGTVQCILIAAVCLWWLIKRTGLSSLYYQSRV